uniref:Uncharacterized protein n=1 Tax=Tanacetum cinerariifolium TaxID=118510 RepID=A0A699GLP8_TANCI|nr:hypothetical protein [Tanacetum cinerariifolium]
MLKPLFPSPIPVKDSNSFLKKSDTSLSLPTFETFIDHTEEINSGSTTTHVDYSLPKYDSLLFEIEPDQGKLTSVVVKDNLEEPRVHVPNVLTTHPTLMLDSKFIPVDNSLPKFEIDIEEKNSGSTTIHANVSLSDLESFNFDFKPDPSELTSIVDSRICENILSATNVNLPPKEDNSPLFAYVVWIIIFVLTYPMVPPHLFSFENEDIIFDPGITNCYFHSLLPNVSHRHLRIEESLRAQESDKGKEKEVVGPSMNMMEEGGKNKNNKQNKRKKCGFKDNNGDSGSNKKPKLECWKCGKTSHFKRDFRSGNKKNNASASGSRKAFYVQVVAIVWWIDSDAKTHVYKDHCWFKIYEVVEDECVLYIGDDHFAPVHGKGSVGYRVIVRLLNPKRKTLGEKGIDCIFVGYAEHSKAYRFYVIEPNNSVSINIIIESRDVIFDENRFSSIPKPKDIIPKLDESQRDEHLNDVPSETPEPRKEAIDDEIGSIVENNTWVLSDLPPGCKSLVCKWGFKRKMKVDGTIDKFKVRLVIQGFRQKEGIDYFDTYASVARITTIGCNEHNVCKLVKSLYGLKQASKQWHQKFDETVSKVPNTKDTIKFKLDSQDITYNVDMFHDTFYLPMETPDSPFVAPVNIHIIESCMQRVGYQGVVDKVVEDEKDEESYADKFVDSMIHDDVDDSDNRLEPEIHKENPKHVDDDDENEEEKKDEKQDDEMGSLENRVEKMQTPIPTTPRSPRINLSSDMNIVQELTDTVLISTATTSKHPHKKRRIYTKYSHLSGALRRMATNDLIEGYLKQVMADIIIQDRDAFQAEVSALIYKDFDAQAPKIIEELFKNYRKFEKSSTSNTSCRDDNFHSQRHDDNQEDVAPPKGKIRVKRHKTSKSSKSAREWDAWDEEIVIEKDKVIPEDETSELIIKFQNVDKHIPTIFDRARMKTTLNDMLSNQFRNAKEPQRNPNEPPRYLYNKDLFFLKNGNTEEKKPRRRIDFDVIIEFKDVPLQRILWSVIHVVQFPLFLFFGRPGFYPELTLKPRNGKGRGKKVTMNGYYKYQLHLRNHLDYIHKHQNDLRSDYLSGLYLRRGDHEGMAAGSKIMLPSTFTGGHRVFGQKVKDFVKILKEVKTFGYVFGGAPDKEDDQDSSWITIPLEYAVSADETRQSQLIDSIYDDIILKTPTAISLQEKAIVCPKNMKVKVELI